MASDIPRQVAGAVRRMPAPRRLLILASTVLAIAAVVGVGLWAADPEWVVLYQDVSYGEAARMTEVLDGAAIRNRLGGDGSAVLVAREDQARARVLLAKEQMPLSGRPGFELFEQKQDWGMTDFTQRITYQRALEGELARTIGSTLGVERAEVHLTIPEPGALRRLDRPAKAAVVLRVRRGVLLPPGAVQGIVAIVANSVDRLSPENIAVTDETGRLLSGAPDDGTLGAGAGRRLELQRSVEEYLAGKAERLLATAGGLGEPEVQVSAQINFDQVERTVESFDPDGQVLQSEGRSETEGSGDGSSDGGGGGGGAGAQTVINNTYQNSRRLERMVSSGAGLTKLTVAVLLDDRSLAADTTGVPRDRRLADVTALVRDAIGFDSARGDRITVTAVPFQQAAPADTTTTEPPRDLVGTLARFIRPAVGVVAILALLLLAFRGMKAIQALGASTMAQHGSAALPAEPGNLPPLGPLPDAVRLKNQVVAETSARPELMAQVVRAWMAEG